MANNDGIGKVGRGRRRRKQRLRAMKNGGYAEVYRGVLKNGAEITVKRLAKTAMDERKEKDFLTEIGTIGHVCHPNVLPLLGCCIDNGLYLIFSFSWRGTVASLLHDASLPPMEWKTRYKVVIETASGLHYLHKGCQRRIIHRDIKSSNILLTADFEPQGYILLRCKAPTVWFHGFKRRSCNIQSALKRQTYFEI